ncbi:MAG TPA: hypothetical protein VK638_47000 [Edaphobacter sp.]|nr:hypothetical protein [Edaphobacter sp.]
MRWDTKLKIGAIVTDIVCPLRLKGARGMASVTPYVASTYTTIGRVNVLVKRVRTVYKEKYQEG